MGRSAANRAVLTRSPAAPPARWPRAPAGRDWSGPDCAGLDCAGPDDLVRDQPQQRDADRRAVRVVVLTSSNAIRDVNLAYQLGANSFLVKPVDFEDFVRVTQALQGYWLWTDKEPEISRGPRSGSLNKNGQSGEKSP